MITITKEQFEKTINDNKPNGLVRFFYGEHKLFTIIYRSILFICFFYFLYMELHIDNLGYYNTWPTLLKIVFFVFNTIFPYVILAFIAKTSNNSRIKRICKELNISLEEYNNYEIQWINNSTEL